MSGHPVLRALLPLVTLLGVGCDSSCLNCGCTIYEAPRLDGAQVLTDTVVAGVDSLRLEVEFFFGAVYQEDASTKGKTHPTNEYGGMVRSAWLSVGGPIPGVTHTLPGVLDHIFTQDQPSGIMAFPTPLAPGRYSVGTLQIEYLAQANCPMSGESWRRYPGPGTGGGYLGEFIFIVLPGN
jgi:hypothetical protein